MVTFDLYKATFYFCKYRHSIIIYIELENSFKVGIKANVHFNLFFLLHESPSIFIHLCVSLHLHLFLSSSCCLPTTFMLQWCLCCLPRTFHTPMYCPPSPSLSPLSYHHLIHPLLSISTHTTLLYSRFSPPLTTLHTPPFIFSYLHSTRPW